MFNSSNPVLNDNLIKRGGGVISSDGQMTIQGTATKSLILLMLAMITAGFTWTQVFAGQMPTMWLMFGGIGGLVVAIFTCFKPDMSPISAPIYALLQGLVLGGVSAMYEVGGFEGIVMQAVALTFGTAFVMFFLYQSRIIKVTEKFQKGMLAAIGGICVLYLISFVMSFFGVQIPFIYDNGPIGIGFSFLVVGIAALSLTLDFNRIETLSDKGAPKYMEWYSAFGLMVTLIWLYLEMLRLLSKMRSRN